MIRLLGFVGTRLRPGFIIGDNLAHFNIVLGDVPDQVVFRKGEWPVIGLTNGCIYRVTGIRFIEEMVSNGMFGFDSAHDLAKSLRRGVNIGSHSKSGLGGLAIPGNQLFGGQECFMNGDIGILGIFDIPGIGFRITADDNLQPVPVKGKADRPVSGMDSRPGFDRRLAGRGASGSGGDGGGAVARFGAAQVVLAWVSGSVGSDVDPLPGDAVDPMGAAGSAGG